MLCSTLGVSGGDCASLMVGLTSAISGLAIGSLVTWLVANYYAKKTKSDIETAVKDATKRLVDDVPKKIAEKLDAVAKTLEDKIPKDAAANVTRNNLINTAINAAPFFATVASAMMKPTAPSLDDAGPGKSPES